MFGAEQIILCSMWVMLIMSGILLAGKCKNGLNRTSDNVHKTERKGISWLTNSRKFSSASSLPQCVLQVVWEPSLQVHLHTKNLQYHMLTTMALRVTRTIGHRSAGATATVSSCHNTDGSGATGKTYFDCVTYPDMSRKTISNLGTATLNPSIGNPSTDVDITYYISAYTSKSSNTYWSSGSIAKKS